MPEDLNDTRQTFDTDLMTWQKHDCDTGIAANDMYRMSQRFVDYLSTQTWHRDTHRVFHALLHRTCRGLPEWSCDAAQPDEGDGIRSVRLREVLGLRSTNCNRNLSVGVAELGSTGMFEWLGFRHGNEFLSWRYRPEILGALLENGVYGLFDASALPGLKQQIDFQIFCQTSLVRRMRKPRFAFTVMQARVWAGREDALWADISRSVISALQVSCRHYGLTACLLLDRRGSLRGTDHVEVRMQRPGCFWTAKDMMKLNTETERLLVVDGSGSINVRPGEFPEFVSHLRRAGWCLNKIDETNRCHP